MNIESREKVRKFASKYPTYKYKKYENIYRPGDTPQRIAFIVSGYIRVYIITKDGQEFTINFLSPYDFFFTLVYCLGYSNKHYYQAITPVIMHKIPREDMINMLLSDPPTLMQLVYSLCRKHYGLMTNIEFLISGAASTKVASILVLLGRRFSDRNAPDHRLLFTPTHQDIAGMLGIARETVSIQITDLIKQKIISYEGRKIIINNYRELQQRSALGNEEQ